MPLVAVTSIIADCAVVTPVTVNGPVKLHVEMSTDCVTPVVMVAL